MLEVCRATVRRGSATLLDAVSIDLAPGEIVAIVGPNGAGKSTLLRVMAGLERPASGQIRLDGVALDRLQPAERARRIAFLPQERRIEWGMSVREIVRLARFPYPSQERQEDEQAVETAMVEADVAHLANRAADTLSGGEQARVLFARALGVNAVYMLADEPAMALDPRHQLSMMESLRRRAQAGQGIAVILHDLTHVARFAGRVVLLAGGRLVAAGPTADILTPERIGGVYGVDSLDGTHERERYVIPWRIRPIAAD